MIIGYYTSNMIFTKWPRQARLSPDGLGHRTKSNESTGREK